MATNFLLRRFLPMSLGAVACGMAAAQVNVTIYSGFSASGDGTPFTNPVGSFSSAQINFYGGNPNWHPFGMQSFGAVLTGLLHATTSGTYTFGLYHDDGTSMTLDGQPFINGGGLGGTITAANPITLVAGEYHAFSINFWEDGLGPSGIDLDVLNGGNFNLVPAANLVVPEPCSLLAMGLGLLVLKARRRAG